MQRSSKMTKAAQARLAGAALSFDEVFVYSGFCPRSGGGSQIFGPDPPSGGGSGSFARIGGAEPGGAVPWVCGLRLAAELLHPLHEPLPALAVRGLPSQAS
jgi:hypothetical protein